MDQKYGAYGADGGQDFDKVKSQISHAEGMTTFQMTCVCGDTMKVESTSREQAVSQLKTMMNESAVAAHMKEKHPGEPMIPVSQVHAVIEKTLKEV